MHGDWATVIGSAGVGLLLIAYFLNISKILNANGYAYLLLNLTGAGLACLSSWMIDFMPFVVLEGVWAAVTAFALMQRLRGASAEG